MAYDYYASGAETEQGTRDNREGFAHYRLLPRILRDVSKVDTSCMFLGASAETARANRLRQLLDLLACALGHPKVSRMLQT